MVPMSERRHRIYEAEISAVKSGLRLLFEKLLVDRDEPEQAEVAFKLLQRLNFTKPGRPNYQKFSWETVALLAFYFAP